MERRTYLVRIEINNVTRHFRLNDFFIDEELDDFIDRGIRRGHMKNGILRIMSERRSPETGRFETALVNLEVSKRFKHKHPMVVILEVSDRDQDRLAVEITIVSNNLMHDTCSIVDICYANTFSEVTIEDGFVETL
ncbi:TPA: hypothetical protein DF272_03270 [Candidatus Falkowbacteria bacterium]|nr:hypothetical protein [Candidatus Falkowbacteria bacterium]